MGKVAFVTGADRGLGFHITQWLLENKYKVFAGQYLEEWNFLADLKLSHPEQLELVPLDIGSSDSVKRAARMVSAKTGHVDLIVNNAGIGNRADHANVLVELDFDVMMQIYNVNTLGALRVNNALMGLLLQSEDKLIVNISSEAGSISENKRKASYGYCMSKAAMNMHTSILHNHLRDMGGQVMVFHPGWMQTYMSGKLNPDAPISPEESAGKIMSLVQDHKTYLADQPAYLDLNGKKWTW
ncbi:SDR family NAD(P)-dependent oxidoreductase [Paenibacillus sp. WQ 127069]|uniref:SDR family NAD(P)-dependent oxidoreductase n=1 Tax=Paenibacillus baimaensis TaxID=2982185 RepID=A0ABT2UIA6_9BACL|nr:SDR family NAD(P)-dependent oxidoreductase [Paenibacillus sp. WQ 127069]MCU6794385.1 SDR family NAD(P)-dependent oxidoreductase [Paenibacillus sp. WQ 127069]